MTLTKEDLERLANSHQKKADRAFERYQETGDPKHEREYRKHEDLTEALCVARDADDEHREYVRMRVWVSEFCDAAEDILSGCYDKDETRRRTEKVLKDLLAYGEMNGLFTRKFAKKEAEV